MTRPRRRRRRPSRPGGHLVLALLGVLLAAPLPAAAQLVMGTVADAANEHPVEGARVVVRAPDGSVRAEVATDRAGRFFARLDALTPGDLLVVESLGYETQRVLLGDLPTWSPSGVELVVAIPPAPLAVEGLVATVRSRSLVPGLVQAGFYERQEAGAGKHHLVTEAERASADRPSDLVRRVQGVTLDRRGNLQGYEPRLTRTSTTYAFRGGGCYPAVVVDGALVRRSGSADDPRVENAPFDQLVSAGHVQALEVYDSPAGFPARFSGLQSGCGLVVVWTRLGG